MATRRRSGVSVNMPGICLCVNRQDQQAIDDLFQHLNQAATQAGPPDAEAEKGLWRQAVETACVSPGGQVSCVPRAPASRAIASRT